MASNEGQPTTRALQPAPVSAEEPRIVAVLEHVGALLVPGEQVHAWAVQRRLFALMNRRVLVVATTGRLMVLTRHLIAGYDMQDVRWQDLDNVRIRMGMFGADLGVGYSQNSDLASASRATQWKTIRGLRASQAQDVYRICQAHDQAWREKRRIRDLEEMRARAGGVQIGANAFERALAPVGSGGPLGTADDLATRLQRARDMVEKGLITDAEYEGIKAKIIASL